MAKFYTLDKVDRKLLNLVQHNNLMPTKIMAEKVHISQPTCLRRIQKLRSAGLISADVALVDPFALGYGMLAFLEVSLHNQSAVNMQAFEDSMCRESAVMQCYFVSGDYDYFLLIHTVDMDTYYQFVQRAISGSEKVRHFQSRFPMKCAKRMTQVVFDEKVPLMQVRGR